MNEKNKKVKRTARIAAVFSAFLFLLSAGTVSYAWFRFGAASGDMNLGTAGDAAVTLRLAAWKPDGLTRENGSYVWGEEIKLAQAGGQTPSFGETYSAEAPSLHFGTIDNLSYLKKSNIVWLCLKVKAEEGRNYGGLRLCFRENPYLFIPNVDSASGSADENAVKNGIDPYLEELLRYGCALSSRAPAAFDTSLEGEPGGPGERIYQILPVGGSGNYDLTFSDFDFVRKDKAPSTDDSASDSSSESEKNFSGSAAETDADGYYYLYFRCYPRLETYAYIAESISEYMPCVLQFSLRAHVAIDNRELPA